MPVNSRHHMAWFYDMPCIMSMVPALLCFDADWKASYIFVFFSVPPMVLEHSYHCHNLQWSNHEHLIMQTKIETSLFAANPWSWNDKHASENSKQLRTRQIWGIWKLQPAYSPGNAQFGSKLVMFCPLWPWNLMDDLGKQKGISPLLFQALCNIS